MRVRTRGRKSATLFVYDLWTTLVGTRTYVSPDS